MSQDQWGEGPGSSDCEPLSSSRNQLVKHAAFNKMMGMPARHGELWSQQEVAQLRTMVNNRYTIGAIAAELKRLPNAIEMRIQKERIMIKDPSTAGRLHYLITMLQTGFTTCEVKFNSHGSVYTYKVKTGMLAVDDKAVVCVDGVFKVVTVLNVHSEPVIDIHQPYILKWIVCKVDDAAYNEQTAREEQAIKQIQDDERKAARANAIAELSSMLNVTELKRILGS